METGGHDRAVSGIRDTIGGGAGRWSTGGTVIYPVRITGDPGLDGDYQKTTGATGDRNYRGGV